MQPDTPAHVVHKHLHALLTRLGAAHHHAHTKAAAAYAVPVAPAPGSESARTLGNGPGATS